MPSSLAVPDNVMVFASKDILYSMFLYFEINISWNFNGLATISLSLSHFVAVYVSISSWLEMVSKSFPQACRVDSSAKLQITVSFMKRSKSLIQFVIFNPWKLPWNWIAFYQNSFAISPGLLYHLIRGDYGRLVNEAFTSNPIVSLKQ